MGTLANSEDLNEMSHNMAFPQGLHCLLRQNWSSEKDKKKFLEIISCDPSIYTRDHPNLTVSNFMANSNGLKSVKQIKEKR